MKLMDIKGYLTGIKLRLPHWDEDHYIYFDGTTWRGPEGAVAGMHYWADRDNWEVYEELVWYEHEYWVHTSEGRWDYRRTQSKEEWTTFRWGEQSFRLISTKRVKFEVKE